MVKKKPYKRKLTTPGAKHRITELEAQIFVLEGRVSDVDKSNEFLRGRLGEAEMAVNRPLPDDARQIRMQTLENEVVKLKGQLQEIYRASYCMISVLEHIEKITGAPDATVEAMPMQFGQINERVKAAIDAYHKEKFLPMAGVS